MSEDDSGLADETGEATTTPPAAAASERKSRGGRSGEGRASSRGSTGSTRASSPNPFDLEPAGFTPGDESQPVLEPEAEDDAELTPPEPLVWTPERAGYVVRGVGFALHTLDPMSREPSGERLWRATEADVEELGAPLAAILNRYDMTRALAGHSEEAALGFSMAAYVRRNLAQRGLVLAEVRSREEAQQEPSAWDVREPPKEGWGEQGAR